MLKEVSLRSATAADIPAILEIYAPYVRDTAVTFETEVPTAADMDGRRSAIQSRSPFLVATDGDSLAGYAYASPHRARQAYQWAVESSVYVAPTAQRAGAGRALYRALLALLDAQGFAKVYAGISLPNPASETFHVEMGFTDIGVYRAVGFKAGAWTDVKWLEYTLTAATAKTPPAPTPFSPAVVDAFLKNSLQSP